MEILTEHTLGKIMNCLSRTSFLKLGMSSRYFREIVKAYKKRKTKKIRYSDGFVWKFRGEKHRDNKPAIKRWNGFRAWY